MNNLLLHGHDTVECAYYLHPKTNIPPIDYEELGYQKEALKNSKRRDPKRITIGEQDFLLHPYGSTSGFPFMIENGDAIISFGEFNNPSFFVKYKSMALWREGAFRLHEKFMSWATSIGLGPYRNEGLSRVDFSFDYEIPEFDLSEDDFTSLAMKDSRYRKHGQTQTMQFGMGDIVLRVYDKVAEINEASNKTWFFDLWGTDRDVWRIEWQVRKRTLKRFDIRTFDDLRTGQGDVLRYLATEHTVLRQRNEDKNKSRWPTHPLWLDLQGKIESLDNWGVYRAMDDKKMAEERITRMAISINGYLKRIAAMDCVKFNKEMLEMDYAVNRVTEILKNVNDALSWKIDVDKRIDQIRAGKW